MMSLYSKIYTIWWKAISKLWSDCHLFCFYKGKYGIKNINLNQLVFPGNTVLNKLEISPSLLCLGPDFLKDKYTLLDTPLVNSPHAELMSLLYNGKEFADSEYIKRYYHGYLDWRRGIKDIDPSRFKKKNKTIVDSVLSGNYEPVKIYQIGGSYYVFDGKHRAALCAVLGKDVKCAVVSSDIACAGVWNRLFTYVKGNKSYNKHAEFYGHYLNSNNSINKL